jgi:hypothetical protein
MASGRPIIPVYPGDRVEMRKVHPCGGSEWIVTRAGMDVGLKCARCQRLVLIPRSQFERQLRRFLARASLENMTAD